jgi:hypothetical protein
MSERNVRLEMSEGRARMLREGVSRIRFWLDGFRAAGGDKSIMLLEPTLIALQIELDRAIAKPTKGKPSNDHP